VKKILTQGLPFPRRTETRNAFKRILLFHVRVRLPRLRAGAIGCDLKSAGPCISVCCVLQYAPPTIQLPPQVLARSCQRSDPVASSWKTALNRPSSRERHPPSYCSVSYSMARCLHCSEPVYPIFSTQRRCPVRGSLATRSQRSLAREHRPTLRVRNYYFEKADLS
jgi:hypothetical protein